MRKAAKPGRPYSSNPLSVRLGGVRITSQEDADFRADMERLTELTGVRWDYSKYARMAMRTFKGTHLKGDK